MKKTTFLIGLPRCGSLALSVMMDNPYCYAHHEGLDFDRKGIESFDETASGALMNRAHKAGKNYLCCDTSMSLRLIGLYCEANVKLGKPATHNLQIIRVVTSIAQSTESMTKLMGFDEGTEEAREIARKILETTILCVNHALVSVSFEIRNVALVPFLTIHKEGNRFTGEQIKSIALFCGAWPDLDMIEQRKLTYLSDVSMSITQKHLDAGIDALSWP